MDQHRARVGRLQAQFIYDRIPAGKRALHAEATLTFGVSGMRRDTPTSEIGCGRRTVKDADALVKNPIWLIGGDGWACDIGFGSFRPCVKPDGE